MNVVFIEDWTDREGVLHAKGEVKDLPQPIAIYVIKHGHAQLRPPLQKPAETKG